MIVVQQLGDLVPASLIAALGSERIVQDVVEGLAAGAHGTWLKLAGKTFTRAREDYQKGLREPPRISRHQAVVSLVGAFPNMLEQGAPSWKLQDTLLGPNVPVVPPGQRGKHEIVSEKVDPFTGQKVKLVLGYWRIIPFSHTPPGGSTVAGTPMGDPYKARWGEEFARRYGGEIYARARQLEPLRTEYTEHPRPARDRPEKVYGNKLRIPEQFDIKAQPYHAAGIYQGMIREEKAYRSQKPGGTQSQFVTFRVISTRGRPWVHPGFTARNLAEDVSKWVSSNAADAFETYVKGQGR